MLTCPANYDIISHAESRGGEAPKGGMRVMNENLYIYLIILLIVLEIIREIKK